MPSKTVLLENNTTLYIKMPAPENKGRISIVGRSGHIKEERISVRSISILCIQPGLECTGFLPADKDIFIIAVMNPDP